MMKVGHIPQDPGMRVCALLWPHIYWSGGARAIFNNFGFLRASVIAVLNAASVGKASEIIQFNSIKKYCVLVEISLPNQN